MGCINTDGSSALKRLCCYRYQYWLVFVFLYIILHFNIFLIYTVVQMFGISKIFNVFVFFNESLLLIKAAFICSKIQGKKL